MLWLAAKQQAGKAGLVAAELAKLHEHLLAPLGVRAQPATRAQAIGSDRAARRRQEHRLNCQVPRAAEQAVSSALRYTAARPVPLAARRTTGMTGHAT